MTVLDNTADGSSITLNWSPPLDQNGAMTLWYTATCDDDSTYLTAAANSWRQPSVTYYAPAPPLPDTCNSCLHAGDGDCDDGGPGSEFSSTCSLCTDTTDCGWRASCPTQCNPAEQSISVTMDGLTPGTSYYCYIASNNTIGGFEPVFNSPFPSLAVTPPSEPDPIPQDSMSCEYTYDTILPGSGSGAPDGDAPSLIITLNWNAPRANDAAENAKGPPFYHVVGPLFGQAVHTTLAQARTATATASCFNQTTRRLT